MYLDVIQVRQVKHLIASFLFRFLFLILLLLAFLAASVSIQTIYRYEYDTSVDISIHQRVMHKGFPSHEDQLMKKALL